MFLCFPERSTFLRYKGLSSQQWRYAKIAWQYVCVIAVESIEVANTDLSIYSESSEDDASLLYQKNLSPTRMCQFLYKQYVQFWSWNVCAFHKEFKKRKSGLFIIHAFFFDTCVKAWGGGHLTVMSQGDSSYLQIWHDHSAQFLQIIIAVCLPGNTCLTKLLGIGLAEKKNVMATWSPQQFPPLYFLGATTDINHFSFGL